MKLHPPPVWLGYCLRGSQNGEFLLFHKKIVLFLINIRYLNWWSCRKSILNAFWNKQTNCKSVYAVKICCRSKIHSKYWKMWFFHVFVQHNANTTKICMNHLFSLRPKEVGSHAENNSSSTYCMKNLFNILVVNSLSWDSNPLQKV